MASHVSVTGVPATIDAGFAVNEAVGAGLDPFPLPALTQLASTRVKPRRTADDLALPRKQRLRELPTIVRGPMPFPIIFHPVPRMVGIGRGRSPAHAGLVLKSYQNPYCPNTDQRLYRNLRQPPQFVLGDDIDRKDGLGQPLISMRPRLAPARRRQRYSAPGIATPKGSEAAGRRRSPCAARTLSRVLRAWSESPG